MCTEGNATKYQAWLACRSVDSAVSHVVAGDASRQRMQKEADKERTGPAWPGPAILSAFSEDRTAERQRALAAERRKETQAMAMVTKSKEGWEADDCRHE